MSGLRRQLLLIAGFGLLAGLLPLVDRDQYHIFVVILVLFNAYLGMAWNLLGGYAGQFSFGHAAFFGLGAYTSTVLLVRSDVSPWVGMWLGGLLALLFGLLIGLLSFRYRLHGPYFALATLAFAETARLIATNLDQILAEWAPSLGKITGGPTGILIPLRDDFGSMLSLQREPFYYTALGGVLLVMVLTACLEHVRLGYAFAAVRENEDVAQAVGIEVSRIKLIAMMLSAFLTALGGTFYAQLFQFIDPHIAVGVPVSINILLPAIVGGAGTLFGPLLGAVLLVGVSEETRRILQGLPGAAQLVYGLILVLVIIFLPGGLVSLPRRLRQLGRRLGRASVRPTAIGRQETA